MGLDGAWVAVTPFFVAFAITLFQIAIKPYTWISTFENARKYRLQQYSKRERRTFWVRASHAVDAYWWVPIALYFVCVTCSVLGYVFFSHAGYDWEGAIPADKNVPLLFIGFWLSIILTAPVLANYLVTAINRNGMQFLLMWGVFFLHLAVTITFGVLEPTNPACYLQIPMLLGLLLLVLATSNTYIASSARNVIKTIEGKPCDAETAYSYAAGGCANNK